jgi:hypothetical protein
VGKEVSLDVEEFGRINDTGNLGFGEVIRREFLGSSEGSTQVSVVSSDDYCTSSSSGRGRLNLVCGVNTFSLVGLLEGLHEVIVTDGSDVGNRAGWEDVLFHELGPGDRENETYGSSSGGVLSSTTGNIVDLGIGDNIVVDGHMLLLG